MLSSLDYTKKTVVVAGCYSGIGRAVAELLIELGAYVHGFDIRDPEFPMASFTAVDLSNPKSIDAATAAIPYKIDALFNCAGLAPTKDQSAVIKVNFLGCRYFTERLLPHMGVSAAIASVGSNGGASWRQNLSTVEGFLENESFSDGFTWWQARAEHLDAYSFSKQAIAGWTMHQAVSLIKRGIRVNCSSPGTVQTPMLEEIETVFTSAAVDTVAQPIGRRSTPREQAIPLLVLNSELFSYVNGVDLPVDGGFIASQLISKP